MLLKIRRNLFWLVLVVAAIGVGTAFSWNPVLAQSAKTTGPARGGAPISQREVRPASNSGNVPATWFAAGRDGGKATTIEELVGQLPEQASLRAQKRVVKGSGGGQPQSVIIIYRENGSVLICIGSAAACKEAAS